MRALHDIICLLAVSASAHKPFINIGQKCPSVTPSENFNADSYLGLWYNLANSPFIWMDSNNTCAWAHYNLIKGETDPKDDYIRVINSEISARNGKRTYAIGEAYITDTPGELSVAFFSMPSQNADNYIVLSTDNIKYSYVWSCHDFESEAGVVGNMPILWILNRDFDYSKKMVVGQIADAMEILEAAGYNTEELEVNMGITDQKGCGYGKKDIEKRLNSENFLQGSGDQVNISCSVEVGVGF